MTTATTYFAWDVEINNNPWRLSIKVEGNTVTYTRCDVWCDCGGITKKVSGLSLGRQRYKQLRDQYGEPTTAWSTLN